MRVDVGWTERSEAQRSAYESAFNLRALGLSAQSSGRALSADRIASMPTAHSDSGKIVPELEQFACNSSRTLARRGGLLAGVAHGDYARS
jgi:hypothetical protein